MATFKSILTLLLILLPAVALHAGDADGKRIWMDDPGFDSPKAGKWWLDHAQRIDTDAHDGEHALALPSAKTRAVSNFPFQIHAQLPYVRMELWAKNLDSKESQLLVKLDVRQRKTNKWVATEDVAKCDIPVSDQWQKLTVTFKVPETDQAANYFKLELFNNWGNFIIDSIKAFSIMQPDNDKNTDVKKPVEQSEHYTPDADKQGQWFTHAQAGLPNVLIIGDSISIGYTRMVAANLKGVANVYRPIYPQGNAPINCGDTKLGLKDLDQWLSGHQWDVIHFNWGLHDLCYRHPDAKVYGNRDKVNGTISVPIEQYKKNLTKLITQLQSTGAKLIWASTTLVPAGEAGRHEGDEIKYNAVALELVQKHNIAVNDLHQLTAQMNADLFTTTGDVHFKPQGYEQLASQVADSIKTQLTR
jgi:lysophospholipase L1-like esterase